MHLDCVFSILGDDCCLMLDEMMGAESPSRRLVDEWTRTGAEGRYECTRSDVEFSEFMRDEDYHIIPIAAADQLVRGVPSSQGTCGLGNCRIDVPGLACCGEMARQQVRHGRHAPRSGTTHDNALTWLMNI